MTMIKNLVVELFILLLLACTVFIYKLPSTMNTWLFNCDCGNGRLYFKNRT